jgi:hypothetical protein
MTHLRRFLDDARQLLGPVDWFELIVLALLIVPVVRFSLAFQFAEPDLQLFGWNVPATPITGLVFGFCYELAAYIGFKVSFAAKRRKLVLWYVPLAAAGVQTLVGACIVVPVLMTKVQGVQLASILSGGLQWAWASLVHLATVLALVTLATARAAQPQQPPVAQKAHPVAAEKKPVVAGSIYPRRCKCGFVARNRQAWAGHSKSCKRGD